MNETYTLEVQLTDGQTVYINDVSEVGFDGYPGVKASFFTVKKNGHEILFNANHVVYIGRASLLSGEKPAPKDDGWIDVKDKMPEPHVPVLGVGMSCLGGVHYFVAECWMVEGVFYFPSRKECHTVTHWRPMPAMPGEVDE